MPVLWSKTMKWNPFAVRLTTAALFLLLAAQALRADVSAAPDIEALIQAGRKTKQKLLQAPAQWVIRCQLTPDDVLMIKVVVDGDRRSKVYAHRNGSQTMILCRVVEKDGVWFVDERGDRQKTRPYEATLHFPGAYFYHSLADLIVVTDGRLLAEASFQSRKEGIATYRALPSARERQLLEQSISTYDQLAPQNPKAKNAEMEQQILTAKRILSEGIPLRVDETTGLIIETRIQNLPVSVNEFEWLEEAPAGVFNVQEAGWGDQTAPWSDPKDWMMVAYDPLAAPTAKKPALDGFLLNVKSGQLRRLPFDGATAMPMCFLGDRTQVLISAFDLVGGTGLVKLDLLTGENIPITLSPSSGGIPLGAALAPNKQEVAFLQAFASDGIMGFQMRIVDLASSKIRSLGKPGRLGGPFSWLPDGSGLILKRFIPTDSPAGIEDRMICRMTRDGKLTDVLHGDMPLVFNKSQRILYEEEGLWHTCNLDGSDSKLFANGLKGHGFPSVSADEEHIAFMRFDKSTGPVLLIFDLGKSDGRRITSASGIVAIPTWR
jgi:hypothetical protein